MIEIGRRTLLQAAVGAPVAAAASTWAAGPATAAPAAGRGAAPGPRFTLAVVPDTQYLLDGGGSDPEPLNATFRDVVRRHRDGEVAAPSTSRRSRRGCWPAGTARRWRTGGYSPDDPTSWTHAIPPGRWTHVAIVNDRQQTVIHIDGSRIARNATGPARGITTRGKPFAIGGVQSAEQYGQGFYGWIGDTRIVARALRPAEFLTAR